MLNNVFNIPNKIIWLEKKERKKGLAPILPQLL